MQAAKRPSKRERGKGAKRKRLKEGRRLQQNKAKAKDRKMKPLLLVTKTALLVSVFFFFLVFHFVVVVACPPTFRFSFVVFLLKNLGPIFQTDTLQMFSLPTSTDFASLQASLPKTHPAPAHPSLHLEDEAGNARHCFAKKKTKAANGS